MRALLTIIGKDLRLLWRDLPGLIFLTIAPIVVITVAGFSLANLYGADPTGQTGFELPVFDEDGGALGRTVREWIALKARPAPKREVGVIAGRLPIGMGRVVAPQLNEDNDGVVCLSETEVPGMCERTVMNVSHSAMLVAPGVARAVCAFLATGHFPAVGEARR